MKRGGGCSGDVVVDPGPWKQALQLLQAGHVTELVPEKLLDLVDGVLSTVAEDLEGAGEDKVLILIGEDTSSLQIHDQTVVGEEVRPDDGLLNVRHLEVPAEAMAVKLYWDKAGTVAQDPGSAGSHWVVALRMDGTVNVGARNHAGGGPCVD